MRPSKDFGVGSEAVSTAAGLQEVIGTAVAGVGLGAASAEHGGCRFGWKAAGHSS